MRILIIGNDNDKRMVEHLRSYYSKLGSVTIDVAANATDVIDNAGYDRVVVHGIELGSDDASKIFRTSKTALRQ